MLAHRNVSDGHACLYVIQGLVYVWQTNCICFKPFSFCSICNICIPLCIVSPEGSVKISPQEVLTSFDSNVTLTCSNEGEKK